MKIRYLIASLFFLPLTIMAQKQDLTLQELIPGGKNYGKFVPENLSQLQWIGDKFLYEEKDALVCAAPGKTPETLLDRRSLNNSLAESGLDTLSRIPRFEVPFADRPVIAFTNKGHRIHYDVNEHKIVSDYTLPKEGGNFDFCPSNGRLAFTEGQNLKILSPDGSVVPVTTETEPGIVCGTSVHQNEFGIRKGTFWSPQGSALAFYRMDESMVTDYPFVNIDSRVAKSEPHKYPMAGMKSHHVTIGVYNIDSGKTIWLKTGVPKEKYLTNIAWSPDEKDIYVAELNRGQDTMKMVAYSAITGERKGVLFTETDAHYVEPQHPALFIPGKQDEFIWQSERDGFNHLYLYNTKGEMLRQLTQGEWVVLSVDGFDAKGENLFFTATRPHPLGTDSVGSPLCVTNWKLNLTKESDAVCLNHESLIGNGVHSAQVSPSGKFVIDNYSSWDIPRKIVITDTRRNKVLQTLLTAKNPYEGYIMPEVERGTIKAADGETDLNYFLVKPTDFDSTKKYPVIVYVYGGPHAQLVTGSWMGGVSGWDIFMARRGYILFTVDGRGSANRGHAFEAIIHRNLGVNEMADQVKGVEFLKSKPFVDSTRIGVHGWSYGGFMTTNLMCSYPELFKAGVAGGPVIDWSNYEIMYGERYMDRPQENPEGYRNANLKLKAKNLRGRLLLIHGDVDPVVVWQHSLGFLKACVDGGTYPDYFVYPRHEHNVRGKDRPHLYQLITRYFDDHLK